MWDPPLHREDVIHSDGESIDHVVDIVKVVDLQESDEDSEEVRSDTVNEVELAVENSEALSVRRCDPKFGERLASHVSCSNDKPFDVKQLSLRNS